MVSFSRHRRYCFDAPVARCFIRLTPHLVGLFGWSDLSGWSGLSDWFGLSVGLFVGWSIGLVGLVSVVCGLGSVGLVCLIYRSGLEVGLSGWSGLSIAVSVGLLVWVTIVVTHGDLASDSSIKIFAGCWFG